MNLIGRTLLLCVLMPFLISIPEARGCSGPCPPMAFECSRLPGGERCQTTDSPAPVAFTQILFWNVGRVPAPPPSPPGSSLECRRIGIPERICYVASGSVNGKCIDEHFVEIVNLCCHFS